MMNIRASFGPAPAAGAASVAAYPPSARSRSGIGCRVPVCGLAAPCYVVSMRLVINAEERNLTSSTLDALIEELGIHSDRVAVELNRQIVPRERWSATVLHDGDRLEIVHFVGGGCL